MNFADNKSLSIVLIFMYSMFHLICLAPLNFDWSKTKTVTMHVS